VHLGEGFPGRQDTRLGTVSMECQGLVVGQIPAVRGVYLRPRWFKYRERGSCECTPPGRRAAPVLGIKRCRDCGNRNHRSLTPVAQGVLGSCRCALPPVRIREIPARGPQRRTAIPSGVGHISPYLGKDCRVQRDRRAPQPPGPSWGYSDRLEGTLRGSPA
jgi:hypothetical protein